MSSNAASVLRDVDAYVFDVFGTAVDWFTTLKREVARRADGSFHDKDQDAAEFAREWREGYYAHIRTVNAGGEGSLNFDIAHRQILDRMLASPRWSHLGSLWDDPARSALVQLWHELDAYQDTIPGLTELGKLGTVACLSNGNFRLLLDLAKNKHLPWDGILSTEFFGVYKPTKQAYLAAAYHLGVSPDRLAMVAAHKWDLDGAAQAGLKTVYVPRPAEDSQEVRESVRSKAQGGDVDVVVKDFVELATLAAEARK
ncbi:HAD-like domain-containing protein [Boletus edulis]|nr:HAD-like domain-containing protein [Boletus edulis]